MAEPIVLPSGDRLHVRQFPGAVEAPDSGIMRWFDATDSEQAAIASFTIAKIHYGIAALRARDQVLAGQLQVWAHTLGDITL